MGYTIVLSGLPGTGSFSFWEAFGLHPEIARSSEKEPATLLTRKVFVPTSDNYISHYYKVTEKTKVLLDGSITPFVEYLNFLMTIKDVNRVCCVFRVRNGKQAFFSHISSYLSDVFDKSLPLPDFLNEDYSINYDNLTKQILWDLRYPILIEKVINAIGKENVIIVSLYNLFENQKEILSFLKVDTEFTIPKVHINSTINRYVNRDHFNIMQKIREFVFNNSNRFNRVERRNKRILYRRYNVIGGKNE